MAFYERFAHVYDHCMSDAPYAQWVAYIDRLLTAQCKRKHDEMPTVVDLACGTGNITIPLSQKGYDMIGVDRSVDMLAEARNKADEHDLSVLWLAQDMRALDLYGTVDAVLCVCDGLNYILNENDLLLVYKKVANFLNPDGIFIFDMNTEYKFKDVLRDQTFTAVYSDVSYIWKNRYDTSTGLNEYGVHFFIQHANGTGEHFEEFHRQRAYPVDRVANLLCGAGFTVQSINEAYTDMPLSPDTERVSFVAVCQR